MAEYVFKLTLPYEPDPDPVNSEDSRASANRIARLFQRVASGDAGGTASIVADTEGTAASAIVTCATVANANTVTLNGQALTATQHHARGTITPTTSGVDVDDTVTINTTGILTAKKHHSTGTVTIVIANTDVGDTVTVNGVDFTAAAAEDTEAGEFDISGTATVAATSLAACINASEDEDIAGLVTAFSAAGVVTIRNVATGTGTYSLESSDADGLAVSGATLTAGTVPAADEFDISGQNADTCTSLAAAVNACTALSGIVTAWASATVVTVRAVTAGTGGNSIGLESSDAQLAVSAATLENGAAVANNQFDFGGTDTETATALAAAINASTTDIVEFHVSAAASGAEVTITSRTPGHIGNAVSIASSGATLAITGSLSRLAGGTATRTSMSF